MKKLFLITTLILLSFNSYADLRATRLNAFNLYSKEVKSCSAQFTIDGKEHYYEDNNSIVCKITQEMAFGRIANLIINNEQIVKNGKLLIK